LYKQEDFKTVPEPVLAVLETLPALRLTIWEGAEELMPVQDIGKLVLQEVAKLYTVSKSLSTPEMRCYKDVTQHGASAASVLHALKSLCLDQQ